MTGQYLTKDVVASLVRICKRSNEFMPAYLLGMHYFRLGYHGTAVKYFIIATESRCTQEHREKLNEVLYKLAQYYAGECVDYIDLKVNTALSYLQQIKDHPHQHYCAQIKTLEICLRFRLHESEPEIFVVYLVGMLLSADNRIHALASRYLNGISVSYGHLCFDNPTLVANADARYKLVRRLHAKKMISLSEFAYQMNQMLSPPVCNLPTFSAHLRLKIFWCLARYHFKEVLNGGTRLHLFWGRGYLKKIMQLFEEWLTESHWSEKTRSAIKGNIQVLERMVSGFDNMVLDIIISKSLLSFGDGVSLAHTAKWLTSAFDILQEREDRFRRWGYEKKEKAEIMNMVCRDLLHANCYFWQAGASAPPVDAGSIPTPSPR